METITGYVDHIIYRNADNGYTVLVLVCEEEEITCVGIFSGISEGENIEVTGEYTAHPTYGKQFKAESYVEKEPTDELSIERYLGSGAIKGIGAALAARIVRRFKGDTFRIIEEEPERLAEVKGISERKAMEISDQVSEKRDLRQAMIFLQQYGITLNLAVKIYKEYGQEVYGIIQENPYRLADDISGVGFRIADEIAKKVGAYLMVDMAHYAGIIAAGVYPSPFPYADIVTTTTHKTLRGPRGGVIFCKPELEKKINSAVFPGIQGGPLMHVIAAKAIALGEALTPEYKAWGAQVVKNAAAMADELTKKGLRIVSGRTESHVMLVDLRPKHITGKAAQALLESGHMTANKNAIPNDPEKPFVTSGIRLGTAAMTTRGFKEEQVREVADLIAELLDHPEDAEVLEHVKAEVAKLTKAFPVYAR